MSRLDDLGEILESYEGRLDKSKSDPVYAQFVKMFVVKHGPEYRMQLNDLSKNNKERLASIYQENSINDRKKGILINVAFFVSELKILLDKFPDNIDEMVLQYCLIRKREQEP